ncbi:MAG: ArsR family transcriptional regulator [Candidatus Methanoliparum thermophilum]|uniref:ArsR family transcriptional regulator n=1 Tax=Methanoliparum thermophilum TaxID=2491083 RepID=A0A520KSZ4_METT2|nr:winged helix-turn-helix domain-containing protein [Candidatus Methanoliparum sp. LAM-1]RZN65036.1 MAG: ArsR family transcriptional regulator [Candidatus Methanoliparum thermophilum]BDC36077.1 transcriptional regulator [Candidatus Methanoliparum sp. LAM-1]
MEAILDIDSMKALSCDTRIDILKLLKKRRATLSELSKALKKSKPALIKHLDLLIASEMVVKEDDGHKWIYYDLTEKGRMVVTDKKSEKKSFILLLSSIMTIITGFSILLHYFKITKPIIMHIAAFNTINASILMYLSIVLLMIGILLFVLSYIKYSMNKCLD